MPLNTPNIGQPCIKRPEACPWPVAEAFRLVGLGARTVRQPYFKGWHCGNSCHKRQAGTAIGTAILHLSLVSFTRVMKTVASTVPHLSRYVPCRKHTETNEDSGLHSHRQECLTWTLASVGHPLEIRAWKTTTFTEC